MTRNLKTILLVVGLVCLIPAALFGLSRIGEIYRLFNPYLDTEIAGPTTISSEWLEIVPKQPLRAERQIKNFIIVFDKSQSYEPLEGTYGVRLPDGSIAVPEVQLVDESAHIHVLTPIGVSADGVVFRDEDSREGSVYRAVKVRSSKPIKVSRIYWRCYNQWDVS